jgi:hypothetical protein
MVTTMFELLAYIWLLIGDVVAYCALFGAALTLLIAVFDASRGRSPLRAFKVTADWSIGALCLGILLFSSVILSGQVDAPATMILNTSRLNVAIMLAASVALLVSSLVVSRLIRR